MTETDWDACIDVQAMLEFLRGKVSDRKLRLFACACCWKVVDCLTDETRALLGLAEQVADLQISSNERKTARARAFDASWNMDPKLVSRRGPAKAAVASALAGHASEAAVASAWYTTFVLDLKHAGTLQDELRKQNPSEENARVSAATWDAARKQVSAIQCTLLRCIIGNPSLSVSFAPSWLAWNDAVVVRLAQAAYENRILPTGTLDNACLAILADALEEAGCSDERILSYLRSGDEHYRGCFVVDALLGKS
jgi:hypothetical protein